MARSSSALDDHLGEQELDTDREEKKKTEVLDRLHVISAFDLLELDAVVQEIFSELELGLESSASASVSFPAPGEGETEHGMMNIDETSEWEGRARVGIIVIDAINSILSECLVGGTVQGQSYFPLPLPQSSLAGCLLFATVSVRGQTLISVLL